MPRQDPHGDPAVSLHGVSKLYGDFYAIRDLDISFEPGRIHALVGQNGAGKSTCLGIIAGRISATTGSLQVGEQEFSGGLSAREAVAAGIATVYQELSVFAALSALENVFVGQLRGRAGLVDRGRLRRRYQELAALLGVSVDADSLVGSLPLAQQQIIEIMRGLALNTQVLLLDEPTAVLAPAERRSLFRVMRELRDRGVTVIFVSHYLDEVIDIADTISVFRDGVLVEKSPAGTYSEGSILAAMLGAEGAALAAAAQDHARAGSATQRGELLLDVVGLSAGRVAGVDLHVHAGEIVGIGGLVGSGRSTILRAIAGAQPATEGAMTFAGSRMQLPKNPREAWKLGIGYIPEDRKRSGLVPEQSAQDNIALGDLGKVSRWGIMSSAALGRAAHELAERFGLAARAVNLAAGQLSGGNQQKVLFARWGLRRPQILLADEATRGVDVGSKGGIVRTLRALADEGMGVIFVSSDLKEVAAVSDRIYVLKSGQVVDEIVETAGITEDDIIARAFGVEAPNDH